MHAAFRASAGSDVPCVRDLRQVSSCLLSLDSMSRPVCSVLVVDDNEVDRYLIRRRLNRVEPVPSIFEAGNGEEALAFFNERLWLQNDGAGVAASNAQPPSLIFLDINMPRMNGLEFLDEFAVLLKQGDHIDVKVIMYSTAEIEREERRAMAHDFVCGYYAKGAFGDEVLASIFARHSGLPSYPGESGGMARALVGE